MKVVPLSEVAASDWDGVCDNSRQAWLYHRFDWIALEARFFVLRNLSFALKEGEEIVGVQPLFLSECGLGTWSERLVHSGIHRHTGLAIVDAASTEIFKAARAAAMQRVFELAQELDSDRIQLNVQNLTAESLTVDRQEIPFWVEEHGFYLGLGLGPGGIAPAPGVAGCFADQILDLSGSEDEIFGRFDNRRAIRQGIKAGLADEPGEARQAVAAYYSLAQLAAGRTGESLAPLEYFEDMWDRLSSRGNCAIRFATHEGRRVAAILLGIEKGNATYLGGVSDPDFMKFKVNDFLQWAAVRWMKGSGVTRYRLGPHFPEVPDDWPIARVSRFKKKFGGRSATIIQGSYFRTPERYLEAGIKALMQRCEPKSAAVSNP